MTDNNLLGENDVLAD